MRQCTVPWHSPATATHTGGRGNPRVPICGNLNAGCNKMPRSKNWFHGVLALCFLLSPHADQSSEHTGPTSKRRGENRLTSAPSHAWRHFLLILGGLFGAIFPNTRGLVLKPRRRKKPPKASAASHSHPCTPPSRSGFEAARRRWRGLVVRSSQLEAWRAAEGSRGGSVFFAGIRGIPLYKGFPLTWDFPVSAISLYKGLPLRV